MAVGMVATMEGAANAERVDRAGGSSRNRCGMGWLGGLADLLLLGCLGCTGVAGGVCAAVRDPFWADGFLDGAMVFSFFLLVSSRIFLVFSCFFLFLLDDCSIEDFED